MKTVKVWFSHTAHFHQIAVNGLTGRILETLYIRDGVYYATNERQFNQLAPYRTD
jgi:hypothetical protein